GIDGLAGRPGIHPALMADLATGRMSVAQIAQRVRHRAKTTAGPDAVHDAALVKRLLREECEDILARLAAGAADDRGRAALAQAEDRYRRGGEKGPRRGAETPPPRLSGPRPLPPPGPGRHASGARPRLSGGVGAAAGP